MAYSSCFSADLVSFAFVFTFDMRDAHINKHVGGGQVIRISHLTIIVWTVCIAAITSGISQTNIGISYTLTTAGIWTASMVFPMYATVLWRHQNVVARTVARFPGSIPAIAAWMASACFLEGTINIASTSSMELLVVGNDVSLISGGVYSIFLKFALGSQDFDRSLLKTTIRAMDDSGVNVSPPPIAQQSSSKKLSLEDESALLHTKKVGILQAATLFLVFVVFYRASQ